MNSAYKEGLIAFLNSKEAKEITSKFLEREYLVRTLPEWIKGDKKAGEVLNVSDKVMAMRRVKGWYIEGVDWKKEDYKKKNGSILWNKDTLLKERGRL